MADGYAFPLGDAAHPYPNTGDGLRRTGGVSWLATTSGAARAGRRPGPGGALAVVTGPERVRVSPLRAVVSHSVNGHYLAAITITVDVALPTRPATGTSRIDYVTVRIYDAGVDASTNLVDVKVELVAGTAAASPSPPSTVPDGSLVIGTLSVPSGSGAIQATQAPNFTVAAGGIVPVASAADRDSLGAYDGLKVFRLDTNVYESRIAGAWVVDPTSAQVAADRTLAINAALASTPGTVTFASGWSDFGNGYAGASFYKDALGVVHLTGVVKGTAAGTILTLPAGFRPAATELFPVLANNALGRINIGSGGSVDLAVGSPAYVGLSGITFKAAPAA